MQAYLFALSFIFLLQIMCLVPTLRRCTEILKAHTLYYKLCLWWGSSHLPTFNLSTAGHKIYFREQANLQNSHLKKDWWEVSKMYILKGVAYSIHQVSVYIRISVLEQGHTVTFKINVLSYLQGLAYKEIILFGLFPRTHSSKLHFVLDINWKQ